MSRRRRHIERPASPATRRIYSTDGSDGAKSEEKIVREGLDWKKQESWGHSFAKKGTQNFQPARGVNYSHARARAPTRFSGPGVITIRSFCLFSFFSFAFFAFEFKLHSRAVLAPSISPPPPPRPPVRLAARGLFEIRSGFRPFGRAAGAEESPRLLSSRSHVEEMSFDRASERCFC
ncbi:hypothetical protein NL676_031085 [Syzygium grande]|nr:hypothetical protein NL676_031085 [Syzygium grande]